MIKVKQSIAKNDISASGTFVTDASLAKDSTIIGNRSSCNDENNYESLENFNSAKDNTSHQNNPSPPVQMNPAYSMETFDGNDKTCVYENLK